MQDDLADFLYRIALRLCLFCGDFQLVALASDLGAWRQYMQHLPVIIRRKKPDGLVVRVLSQSRFFWQTDRSERTPDAQALIVCDWRTLDRGLQRTRPSNGAL